MQVTLRLGVGLGGHPWWPPRTVDMEDGATLADLLGRLEDRVRADLLQPHVLVIVNGRRLDQSEAAHRTLRDGDVVAVVAATAGG
jgi:sulfur carrier protein ThiS